MRVGLVCPYSFEAPGGVQNQVVGLASWLVGAGHEARILAPGPAPAARLSAAGLAEAWFTSAGAARPVRFNGSVARIAFGPGVARRTRAWLADVAPDVLHLHEPEAPSAGLHALLAARTTPVVGTFHVLSGALWPQRLARLALGRWLSRIAVSTAVSPGAAATARRLGLDPRIVPNAIEVADFTSETADTWRGGPRPRVTFLGRGSEPRKGLRVLRRALPKLPPDFAELVVAGDPDVEALPGARMMGRLDDSDRDRLLTDSDVFVAPQLGGESFGIVLVEALAAGASVIASDLPAFKQLLGELAYYFPVGDDDALARALTLATSRPDRWRMQRGRAFAAEFDWARVGPRWLDLYGEARAVGERRRRRIHPQGPASPLT